MFVSTNEMRVEIHLDGSELSAIAYSLRDSLDSSIKNHYKRFDLGVFQKQEGYKLNLMKTMFGLIGLSDVGQEYAKDMKKQIQDAMAERETKNAN